MAASDKSKATPPVRRQPSPAAASAPTTSAPPAQAAAKGTSSLPGIAADAVRSAIGTGAFEKRPYLKFAFANPYNLSIFLGLLAAAGLTLNPVLAVAAVGLEALWLLHAPDSKRLRHLLWDPRFEKVREALLEQERAARLQALSDDDRYRVQTLLDRQRQIRQLAATNPSFTGELLRAELLKTDRLVDAFIDMALTCRRYDEYLASVDVPALDRERSRWEGTVKAGKEGDPHVDVARRNLAIIMKRLEKMLEIRRYLDVARGQLDLIDNSFQLIADQIVTMQSPQQLSGQLDELLDGVESIRQTVVDTERILGSMGIEANL